MFFTGSIMFGFSFSPPFFFFCFFRGGLPLIIVTFDADDLWPWVWLTFTWPLLTGINVRVSAWYIAGKQLFFVLIGTHNLWPLTVWPLDNLTSDLFLTNNKCLRLLNATVKFSLKKCSYVEGCTRIRFHNVNICIYQLKKQFFEM